MTNFDKLLKAAFKAGFQRAISGTYPDFNEWRAGIASRDVEAIKAGDTVEIVGNDQVTSSYHEFYGSLGIARACVADNYFKVYDPHSGTYIANGAGWHVDSLRKVNQ